MTVLLLLAAAVGAFVAAVSLASTPYRDALGARLVGLRDFLLLDFPAHFSWSTLVSRGLLFSLTWWILSDGAPGSWWIGVPAVLLALFASVALLPAVHFRWMAFFRFVPFFLVRSLMAGADVASRAFRPGMPIAPDLVEYPLRLPPGLAGVFMADTVSLLPGTLSTDIRQNVLTIHVLDGGKDMFPELEAVEQGVARMFGVFLTAPGGNK
ncbi:MAG: Na+/H+ antiporter subunit E [Gammaproteobacteria bacterium]|nr:Na+/H+ antiporter subunit E [Gammaproteobacteria bacterium]